MLGLGPALSGLGNGIRLPYLLAQILRRSQGSDCRYGHCTVWIQQRSVCRVHICRPILGVFFCFCSFVDSCVKREMWRRMTAQIYIKSIYTYVCAFCLSCDPLRSVTLLTLLSPNYIVPRVKVSKMGQTDLTQPITQMDLLLMDHGST